MRPTRCICSRVDSWHPAIVIHPGECSPRQRTRGEQILDSTILQEYDSGDVSAQNPIVVFGYSQDASISTDVMRVAGQGVPSDEGTSC